MSLEKKQLQRIIEAALLAAGQPLSLKKIANLFDVNEQFAETKNTRSNTSPKNDNGSDITHAEKSDEAEYDDANTPLVTNDEIRAALEVIAENCEGRGFELKELGSGWRFQVRQEMAPWINRLWDEKPQKYSRALLETLALIAYRQPITRGDIEQIRGVAVSSHIIRTLVEREWVKVVGHRDVPGRPSLYASTRQFLDYFNLKSLDELPTLGELRDLEELGAALEPELALEIGENVSSKDAAVTPADEAPVDDADDDEGSITENKSENESVKERMTEVEIKDTSEVLEPGDCSSQKSLAATENALFNEVLTDDSLFSPVAASTLFTDDEALEGGEPKGEDKVSEFEPSTAELNAEIKDDNGN